MNELEKRYNEVCENYLMRFCEKHEFDYEDAWVGGEVGGVANVGDCFFGFREIKYDIDNDCEVGAIEAWNDYVSRLEMLGCTKTINFKSWVKGAPLPYGEADLQRIEALQKDVEEAKKRLEDFLND